MTNLKSAVIWLLASLLAVLLGALWVGYSPWQSRQQGIGYDRAVAAYALQAQTVDTQRATLAEPAAAQEAAVQVQIRTVTKTLIEKVPVYVKVNDCPLPGGFRLLHDAAAANVEVPGPASVADAAAVPAQDAAELVLENYGICHANAARLVGLQGWVRAQQELKVPAAVPDFDGEISP